MTTTATTRNRNTQPNMTAMPAYNWRGRIELLDGGGWKVTPLEGTTSPARCNISVRRGNHSVGDIIVTICSRNEYSATYNYADCDMLDPMVIDEQWVTIVGRIRVTSWVPLWVMAPVGESVIIRWCAVYSPQDWDRAQTLYRGGLLPSLRWTPPAAATSDSPMPPILTL